MLGSSDTYAEGLGVFGGIVLDTSGISVSPEEVVDTAVIDAAESGKVEASSIAVSEPDLMMQTIIRGFVSERSSARNRI